MAEIINLRRARKQLQRLQAAQDAAENRIRHGRDKAGQAADLAALRWQRVVSDARRDEDHGPGPDDGTSEPS